MSRIGAMLPHRADPSRKSCPKERLYEAFFFFGASNGQVSWLPPFRSIRGQDGRDALWNRVSGETPAQRNGAD